MDPVDSKPHRVHFQFTVETSDCYKRLKEILEECEIPYKNRECCFRGFVLGCDEESYEKLMNNKKRWDDVVLSDFEGITLKKEFRLTPMKGEGIPDCVKEAFKKLGEMQEADEDFCD